MPRINIQLPAPVSGHLPVLEEFKGLAITLIVLFHAGGILVWNNYFHGDLGTDMFILLSGLGLAYGASDEPLGTFYRRRLLRIMPGYWIVLTAYAILNQNFLEHHYSVLNLGAHYLGIHGFFGDAVGLGINDSFWFITAFAFCYGCFLPLQRLLGRLDRFVLAAAVISTALAFCFFFTHQAGLMGKLGFRTGNFFVGMLVGHTLKRGRLELPVNATLALGLLTLGYVPFTQGIAFSSILPGLSVLAFYFYCVRRYLFAGVGERIRRVLVFLGRHSLEIAIIHLPLMRDYNYYLHGRWLGLARPGPLSLTVGMVAALVLTIFFSVELRRLTKRLVARWQSASALVPDVPDLRARLGRVSCQATAAKEPVALPVTPPPPPDLPAPGDPWCRDSAA